MALNQDQKMTLAIATIKTFVRINGKDYYRENSKIVALIAELKHSGFSQEIVECAVFAAICEGIIS